MNENEEVDKGYTIIYYPFEDLNGRPKVAGRFKTVEEKNQFLEQIYSPKSGWTSEELSTICTMNGYNYSIDKNMDILSK